MRRLSRRRFLQKSAAASAAFGTFTISGTKASGQVVGANDRIHIAVCGINGRGRSHMTEFSKMDGATVQYLVDPDRRLFELRTKIVVEHGGNTPECVQDVRQVLENPDLDAVSIATCNHWHSLMGIWACQAGKDVYVEKPLSHNVFEGRQLVAASRKYNRVVQHGTQQRSMQSRSDEISAVHSERYGKLLVSKGYCCKGRWSIGQKPIEEAPPEVDFNLWLGPAPDQPYHGNLVHYNWHWFWDTGNGDTGNQGVHELDVARWAIKDATLPTEVWSLGGRFGYDDQGQTPNTQLSGFKFGDVTLLFETRGLVGKHEGFPRMVHNEYYTTEGMIKQGKFFAKNGADPEDIQPDSPRQVTGGGPFGSFIQAMRSRKPEEINCDAEVGHYSSALCHLANISYRLGTAAPFSEVNAMIGDAPETLAAFDTVRANSEAVGADVGSGTYRLGRHLHFRPDTETFRGDDEANQLLRRNYRQPFTVPELV